MALVVNNNVASLNAQRSLNNTNQSLNRSFERLSSGLRINRAGDDAAGLAISEKMRTTIRSLEQAGRNTQDGVSLLQTAEGAYNEVSGLLGRMRELGVQASNDTLSSSDKAKLNTEFNSLSDEITRIAQSTEFSGTNLLGSNSTFTIQVGSGTTASVDSIDISLTASTSAALGVDSGPNKDVSGTYASASTAAVTTAGDLNITVGGNTTGVALSNGDTVQDVVDKVNAAGISGVTAEIEENADETVSIVIRGADSGAGSVVDDGTLAGVDFTTGAQIAGGTIDITSRANAQTAIDAIDTALETISTSRAQLGAQQNRLEAAGRNTDVQIENLTAAESRIRDVDVAKESARLTRNNILQQAGVSILAQANQAPQAALSLLG